ncbi:MULTISPECIES: hypothetical protein [unclassified Beijerinckia]|uniref:hypothetical protein n=1 Tax=unclassified Beijerinckia TaxID=2638183 RepID=UPI000897AB3B|nr:MULTISPECIES: hypothetical protein [unclassified Beijerinckia]MDH7798654.1 hypothetical protein [Beijerinckia sp. GAS462]SED28136.1 hypothetical protein SAMN05443249_4954 [Beijerinckia sp. 28-YEA-48]
MKTVPVALYLSRMDRMPGGPRLVEAGLAMAMNESIAGVSEQDCARRVAESLEHGMLEGRAAALQESEQLLAVERASFEERLAAERQRWIGEEAVPMRAAIVAGLGQISEQISSKVAEALKPVIIDAVRASMQATLADKLIQLMGADGTTQIEISGPADFVAGLCAQLPEHLNVVRGDAHDGVDVRVAVRDTELQTSIGAWISTLQHLGS